MLVFTRMATTHETIRPPPSLFQILISPRKEWKEATSIFLLIKQNTHVNPHASFFLSFPAPHDDLLGSSSAPGGPSLGRITGSASIETLVRVGIEKENGLGPEAKMVVLHDFTPCVDDELEVKRGQVRIEEES